MVASFEVLLDPMTLGFAVVGCGAALELFTNSRAVVKSCAGVVEIIKFGDEVVGSPLIGCDIRIELTEVFSLSHGPLGR